MRPLFRVALCSQLCWPMLAFADTAYDQMVLDARAGHYTPALAALRQVPAGQASTAQISDHLQIASWAGLDAEVVTVYETQGRHRVLPVQALTAAARAYRNLKRWDSAAELYRQALVIDPQNPDLQLGLALTQADSGQPDEAVTRAKAMVAAKPTDPMRRLALGYALTRANNPPTKRCSNTTRPSPARATAQRLHANTSTPCNALGCPSRRCVWRVCSRG
nr:hypothetical protein GCM10020185_30630 [Pseudomonas brassicacearum subsp. brassicacearum]